MYHFSWHPEKIFNCLSIVDLQCSAVHLCDPVTHTHIFSAHRPASIVILNLGNALSIDVITDIFYYEEM